MDCPTCRRGYSVYHVQPKIIPKCGHTACYGCLTKQISNGSLRCTACSTTVACEDASQLPTNYAIISLLQSNTRKVPMCKQHNKPLEAFCTEVNEAACMECLFQPKFKGKPVSSFEQAFKGKVQDFNMEMKSFGMLAKKASEAVLERKLSIEKHKRDADVVALGVTELFKQIKQLVTKCESDVLAMCKEAAVKVGSEGDQLAPHLTELTHTLMSPLDVSNMEYDTFVLKTQEKRNIAQQIEKLVSSQSVAIPKFDQTTVSRQLAQLSKSIAALVHEVSQKPSIDIPVQSAPQIEHLSSPKHAGSQSHFHSKSVIPSGGFTSTRNNPPSQRGEQTPQLRHKHTPSKCSTTRSRSPMLKTDVLAAKRREAKINKIENRENTPKEVQNEHKESNRIRDVLGDATNRDTSVHKQRMVTPQKGGSSKLKQVASPTPRQQGEPSHLAVTKADLRVHELSPDPYKKQGLGSASLPHVGLHSGAIEPTLQKSSFLRPNQDRRANKEWDARESGIADKYHLFHLESQRLSLLTESNQEQSAAFNNTLTSAQKLSNFAPIPSLEQQLAAAPVVSEPKLYDYPPEAKLTKSVFESDLYNQTPTDSRNAGTKVANKGGESSNSQTASQTLASLIGKPQRSDAQNHLIKPPAQTPQSSSTGLKSPVPTADDAVRGANEALAKFNELRNQQGSLFGFNLTKPPAIPEPQQTNQWQRRQILPENFTSSKKLPTQAGSETHLKSGKRGSDGVDNDHIAPVPKDSDTGRTGSRGDTVQSRLKDFFSPSEKRSLMLFESGLQSELDQANMNSAKTYAPRGSKLSVGTAHEESASYKLIGSSKHQESRDQMHGSGLNIANIQHSLCTSSPGDVVKQEASGGSDGYCRDGSVGGKGGAERLGLKTGDSITPVKQFETGTSNFGEEGKKLSTKRLCTQMVQNARNEAAFAFPGVSLRSLLSGAASPPMQSCSTPKSAISARVLPNQDEKSSQLDNNYSMWALGGGADKEHLTIEKFDSSQNSWTEVFKSSLAFECRSKFGTIMINGKDIMIFGGKTSAQRFKDSCTFDLAKRIVKESSFQLSEAKSGFGYCVRNNKLYVAGGNNGKEVLKTFECYDLSSNTLTRLPDMLSPRDEMCLVLLGDQLYAIGGGSTDGVTLSSVEKFNFQNNRWEATGELLIQRRAHAAAVAGGLIYIVGGYDGQKFLYSCEKFDPSTGMAIQIKSLSESRCTHTCQASRDGSHLIAAGGFNGSVLSSVEKYSIEKDSWTKLKPMTHERFMHGMVGIQGSISL